MSSEPGDVRGAWFPLFLKLNTFKNDATKFSPGLENPLFQGWFSEPGEVWEEGGRRSKRNCAWIEIFFNGA